MSVMIQVRNVPEELHRKAKARAALAGMSLSDYVLKQLEKGLERPSREELRERIAALPRIEPDRSPAELIREDRDAR